MRLKMIRQMRRLMRRKRSLRFSRKSDSSDTRGGSLIGRWVRNHGIRILLAVVLAIAIRLLFPLATTPEFPEFEPGMVAPRDVIAKFSCNVYKDQSELSAEKIEQANTIFPVLEFIPDVLDSTTDRIDRFFMQLDESIAGLDVNKEEESVGNNPDDTTMVDDAASRQAGVIAWLDKQGIKQSEENFLYLKNRERRDVQETRLKEYISQQLERGVLTDDSMERINKELVTVSRDGKEKLLRVDRLVTQSQSFRLAWDENIDPDAPEASRSIFVSLINVFLKPNVILNELETSRRIVQAEAQVSPVKGQVLKGEKIIAKGYRITEEDLEKYHAVQEESMAREPRMNAVNATVSFLGTFLINAFLLLIFGLYLFFYRRQLYDSFRSLMSFSTIFLLVMIPAAMIARLSDISASLIPMLIPISIASLLIAMIYDVRIAVVAILVLSILIGGQESFGYDVLFISLMGGISGGLSIRIIRRRRQLIESILYITGGYILATVSMDMIKLTPLRDTVQLCGWGGINAVLSTLVAWALLPVFEYVFNETTDITLMELSDFNHPLLKSLVIRAPGTWAHTLAVSSLAETAAEAIEANSLLARVGCYYHDVGKIRKPEYFIENQSPGNNPHDSCSPNMSAMIIENHVKEGIELAREAKLPQRIIDFIPEHHGTTKISFFYEKAKEENDGASISVHDYSYQGPKPRSKETAICMIADSVESMSRTLNDPSPSRIRGMVKGAIKSKIEADQLEMCDLTFKDIHLIEEGFVKVLLARFHSRIEYLKEVKEKKTNGSKDSVADGARQSGQKDGPVSRG